MRKFISIALTFAAVAVVSCQKDNSENINLSGEPFSFTAGHIDTKTVLVDNVKTYWTSTDQLAAFDGTGTPKMFSTDITENSASAKFTCEDFVLPANYETAPLLAFYPYNSELTTDFATKVDGIVFPGTQQVVDNGFDPDATVAWAMGTFANKNSLAFNNLYSLLKFTVSENINDATVTVKANNPSDKLTGTASLSLSTGTITMTTGSQLVSLTGNLKVGKTYYIAVAPGTYSSGITVSINGVDIKKTTDEIVLNPNQIRSLGTIEVAPWRLAGTFNNVSKWSKNAGSLMMFKNVSGIYVAPNVKLLDNDIWKFQINDSWEESSTPKGGWVGSYSSSNIDSEKYTTMQNHTNEANAYGSHHTYNSHKSNFGASAGTYDIYLKVSNDWYGEAKVWVVKK